MPVSGRRDEQGAVAIIFALMAVLLMSIAALGIDLGNAVARRTATQTQADFAAFAAAGELESSTVAGATPPPAVVDTVRDSLNANQPQDDTRTCWRTSSCVTSTHLTDSNLANGEVRFTDAGLQVVAPQAWVDFGFAEVFGSSGTNVSSRATVNVFSGGKRVMPAYGVSGCDYGRQTLTDPARGQVITVPPVLAHPGHVNGTDLVAPPALTDAAGASVNSLTVGSTGNMMTLSGSKWKDTRKVGFFRDGTNDPALVLEQPTFWRSGDGTRTSLAPHSENPPGAVQLMIPDAVTQAEAVWYVRVFNGPGDTEQWSPLTEAPSFRVGSPVLECASGSDEGNFGALRLPRTDVGPSDYLAMNIAVGAQKPLTPTIHQWAVDNPTLAGVCVHSVNGAVASDVPNRVLRRGTNCVGTDPGLPATAATQGLITGVEGKPGMLTTEPTRNGCDPLGGSANRTARINNRDYSFNNEVLTCYLTNSTTTLAAISSPAYNGPAVLDKAIFSSPRFIYVPILAGEGGGASDNYSIIDFRPAFITDESLTATQGGLRTATPENGVRVERNDVTQMTVVFFNINALPNDSDVPLIDFLGVGEPITRLVD